MPKISFKTPLVGIETCRFVLGVDEDAVLRLVKSGKLKFAFNIAVPDAHRKLVRVLSLSLIDLAFGTSTQPTAVADSIKYIIPSSDEEILCSVVVRAFNVSSTHIHGLVRGGCFAVARPRRFANDSPGLSRASVVEFLQSRRCA